MRDMRVERVERADGRYLIYYAWLEASADPGMEGADDGADPGDRDV